MTTRRPLHSLSPNIASIAPSSTTTSSNNRILNPAIDTTSPESTQDSAISGLSILDDEQDDFYKRTVSHVRRQSDRSRDRRRMQDALGGPRLEAFRKSRPRARGAFAIEGLRGNEEVKENGLVPENHHSLGDERRKAGKSPTDSEETSSPNVPIQWGRKGRQRNDFLRRISAPDVVESIEESANGHDALSTRRARMYAADSVEEDHRWSASPTQNIEVQGVHQPRDNDRPFATHRSARRPIDDLVDLELDQDHSAMESPSSSRSDRRRLLDITARREIDDVKRRMTTTERLAGVGAGSRSLRRPQSAFAGANGNILGDVTNLPNRERDGLGRLQNTTAPAVSAATPKASTVSRRDLLRQLSRTPSATPSPDPGDTHDRHSRSRKDHEQLTTIDQEDHRLPTPPDDDSSKELAKSKTPLVSGAFIDTPTAQPRSPPKDHKSETQLELRKPNLPTSALAALLSHRSRSHPQSRPTNPDPTTTDPPQDDTTQLSLTSLLASEEPTIDFDNATRDLISNVSSPVVRVRAPSSSTGAHANANANSNEKTRHEEARTLAKLSRTLKNTYRGFKDLSKGMRRMETQIELSDSTPTTSLLSKARDKTPPTSNSHHLTPTTCPHCAHTLSYATPTLPSILHATFLSLLSHLYTSSPATPNRRRLTLLGTLVCLGILWYLTESLLCARYCHPLYASSMRGFGVDPYAPRMPFVTLTIAGRPFRWAWGPLVPPLRGLMGVLAWWARALGVDALWREEEIWAPALGLGTWPQLRSGGGVWDAGGYGGGGGFGHGRGGAVPVGGDERLVDWWGV
ncbi:MAG: hypothetical protein M1828_001871 [Chrysothrix sp. TS-e1954]|nr:MAG: hypothetical protein M1828_001871 [Chrysothrix sp. TS-e1954]